MLKEGHNRTFKLAGTLIAIIIAAASLTTLSILFKLHLANEWQKYTPLPTLKPPIHSDRIVVFAPHCDDETLGCAGLLAAASKNGAGIRVVLITNGDGFRFGVAAAYKTIRVTPEKCMQYAYQRQNETLKALSKLSVPASCVTFLGYPDRGIARLWDTNWTPDNPYVSHSTKWDRSPYKNSFTKNAIYCGESLIRDIQSILMQEKPTHIYIPHPCDNHSDHFATYCFVLAAIEQLRSKKVGFADRAMIYTYLVHRGDWPCPKGEYPSEPLAPPHGLAKGDTKWLSLPLEPELAKLKREAIRAYKTQTAVERGFLMSFARSNELFGIVKDRKAALVREGLIKIDGNSADWEGIAPTIIDSVGDYLISEVNKGGDVRAIYICKDNINLYLRMDFVKNLSKRATYNISLKGLGKQTSNNNTYTISIKPSGHIKPKNTIWAYKKKTLEVAIPLNKLRFEDMFVRVSTKILRVTIDDTGWQGFEFANAFPEKLVKTKGRSTCNKQL